MKQANFVSYCPFELNDIVRIVLDKETGELSDDVYRVDDIICIHRVKSKHVYFTIRINDIDGYPIGNNFNIGDLKLVKYKTTEIS